MKKNVFILVLGISLMSFGLIAQTKNNTVNVSIDLVNIKEDKVQVEVIPPVIKSNEIFYHIPKIIPGTYSEDDYGKFIENLKAYDANGNSLTVSKTDDNSWKISNSKKLAKITYWVNDTYDIEDTHTIFSPAGTNIEEGKNFMINTHAFIGYFADLKNIPYQVTITHPEQLWGATAMIDENPSNTTDVFKTSRYAELIDSPIMYSKPDYTTFTIQGMEIIIAVYSPNGKITAESITPDMKRMMTAQKNFLGNFNNTKKYAVLLYLSDLYRNDAKGFGALEHPTSTTVVMPEMMPADQLAEQLKDVVSHEFFHIVTPLTIHSKEIHDFDYNNPKMSQHLWMYEGVTEYFANLFQVNQDLITEDEFYQRIAGKIANAATMNDTMPFTKLSSDVLQEPYKEQYLNVYQKGALIAMCIDIIIREKSNGTNGILNLMEKLSKEYGTHKAFNDNDLFPKITSLSYPEVGEFLNKYIAGPTPIPYEEYFAKMGVHISEIEYPGNIFVTGQTPVITIDPITQQIVFTQDVLQNDFMVQQGFKPDDILVSINDVKYSLENINDLLQYSISIKDGDKIKAVINRDGAEILKEGTIIIPKNKAEGWKATDSSKENLKNAWLRN